MSRALWAFGALAAILAAALPLLADEAYYLRWSRSLALGYFDHPPGIAWFLAPFGAHPRLGGLLALPLTAWLLTRAARAFGAEAQAAECSAPGAAATLLWTPLGLAGVVLATPDTPLLPLYAGLLWALGARAHTAAGLLLGVCCYAKSTVLVALPAVAILAGGGAVRVLGLGLALYAPHLLWSVEHGGLPFAFQAERLGGGFGLPLGVLGQLAVVTPWVAVVAVREALLTLKRREGAAGAQAAVAEPERRLAWAGLSVLGLWALVGCAARLEPNWPALAWPPLVMLALRRAPARVAAAHRRAVAITALLGVGALVFAALAPPERGPPRSPEAWRACVADDDRIITTRYQEMALLEAAAEAPDPRLAYLRRPGGRASQYDLWPNAAAVPGEGTPACGAVLLGAASELAALCPGTLSPTTRCGRPAALCRCAAPPGLVPGGGDGYAPPSTVTGAGR